MKKTLKCTLFLALMVLALLCVTLIGVSAIEMTEDDVTAVANGTPVKITYAEPYEENGETVYYDYYKNLGDLFAAGVLEGDVIDILADYTDGSEATLTIADPTTWEPIAGNVVINGNGFTATNLVATIPAGSNVKLNGLSIVNTTAGKNAITISGDAVVEITDATIQGANAAIWVSAQVTTPIKITNCTIKAVVQNASADYGFAFYTASNAGLNATNSTFALEFASGVTGCKGKGVFRNDRRCPREGNTDFSWTLGNCTITSALNNAAFFAVNNELHIYAGEGGLTITRSTANGSADLFNVAASATLKLIGTKENPIKLSQTANGYYGPIRLAAGAKVVMDYVEASGARRVVYAPAEGTVTVQATNSKLSTTAGDKWNGIVYFEPGANKTIALNMTLTSCDIQAQGYLVAFSSTGNTATANITVDDATTITFAKTNGAQLFRANTSTVTTITMNGGNYTSSYGSIVTDRDNQSLTLNNVNFKGGTYGVIRVANAGVTVTINGGSYVSASTTWPLFDIRQSATVTIYGGYFECKDDVMFNVGGTATLNIYGGYFHRVGYETEDATFVSVGNATYGSGTANIFGGTFVADYTDVGSVFSIYDVNSSLTAAAYNGMGSAVVTLNEGIVETENEASFNFWENSLKVFNTVSLRLGASVEDSGLRFTSYVTNAFIEMIGSLADAETEITYGTVIVPAKYLEGVSYFSAETVANALVIPATAAGMVQDVNGGLFIRASIYNLPHAGEGKTTEMLYSDAYAVVVYAEYTKDGKTVRNYSNYNEGVHNANTASIANAALKDLSDEMTGEYVNEIVTDSGIAYSKYTDAERELIAVYAADFVNAVKLNGKIYGSFADALAKAGEGDTIYVLEDLTLEAPIEVAQNVKINGQGHTLTVPADVVAHAFEIGAGADLTIDNLNVVNEGEGPWSNSIFKLNGAANLTVNSGYFEAAGVVLYLESCADSVVTLNAPAFTTRSANNGNAAPILVNAVVTLTINGGTYTTNENTSTGNAIRILVDATVTINGGTFDSVVSEIGTNPAYAIFVKEDAKEVLFGEENATFVNSDAIEYYGTYQAFEVDGVLYNSWTDAIGAVAEGGTIVLVKNFDATATMVVNKSITLEGNNCIITDKTAKTHTFDFSGYEFIVNNLTAVSTGKGDWGDAIFFAKGTSSIVINGGVYSAYQMVIQCNNTSSYTTITVYDAEFSTTHNYTGSSKNYAPIMVDGKGDVITLSGVTFTSTNKANGACIRGNANTELIIESEVNFNAYSEVSNYEGTYGIHFAKAPTTAPTGLENVIFTNLSTVTE